jgi:hypothetical protein
MPISGSLSWLCVEPCLWCSMPLMHCMVMPACVDSLHGCIHNCPKAYACAAPVGCSPIPRVMAALPPPPLVHACCRAVCQLEIKRQMQPQLHQQQPKQRQQQQQQ